MRELYKQLAAIYEATFEVSGNVMPRLAAEFEALLEDVVANVVFIDTTADVSQTSCHQKFQTRLLLSSYCRRNTQRSSCTIKIVLQLAQ